MDLVGTITAPVRIGLWVGRQGVGLGLRGVEAASGLIRGDSSEERERERPPERRDVPSSGPTVEPPPRPAAAPPPPPPPAPSEPQPMHVDEGATVVAEFAETGAEDGAGAELDLSAPWEGYDGMHVDEVLARLDDASSESLAAVVLYERATRERAAIIDEAEAQLRRRSGPGG